MSEWANGYKAGYEASQAEAGLWKKRFEAVCETIDDENCPSEDAHTWCAVAQDCDNPSKCCHDWFMETIK